MRAIREPSQDMGLDPIATKKIIRDGLVVVVLGALLACGAPTNTTLRGSAGPQVGHVGAAACARCHFEQHVAWQRSHHFRSMQEAEPNTVAGDFSGVRTAFHGIDTRFLRRDAEYFVETVDASGDRGEFPVRYTFGFRPLQQYLVDAGGGTLHAFDIAWDTRAVEDGGQRWFHLQPDESIDPRHPFFWAGHSMHWASHCADCHSTNVTKTRAANGQGATTTFSEVNVACEACHGPAGEHVRRAESGSLGTTPNAGFEHGPGPGLQWRLSPGQDIATPVGNRDNRDIDMCGACHSLRTPLTRQTTGESYHDAYRIELVDDLRYFPDGQIREESFVLGSFLQSRMHLRGVTCGDCHDPHSNSLVAEGNAVCTQCHRASVYDVEAHHRHRPGTSAGACVDCHMPARTYMGVDDRRDHSFTIPRPALSADLGVPNPCIGCHGDQDNQWVVEQMRNWGVEEQAHWARLYQRLGQGDPRSSRALASFLLRDDVSGFVKASLLAEAANLPPGPLAEVVSPWLDSDDPLVRRGAVTAARGLPARTRWQLLAGRLNDDNAGVRFELARSLAEIHLELPASAQAASLDLYGEYRQSLDVSSDLAPAQHGLAILEAMLGRPEDAEAALGQALELDPAFLPALVDLADVRRSQGRETEAGELLRRALDIGPDSGIANVAFGMHLVRLRRHDEALEPFQKASRSPHAGPSFIHVHAVAQYSLGHRDAALDTLRRGVERWPWSLDLLSTLVLYLDDAGSPEVQRHLGTLAAVAPTSPQVRALRERYAVPAAKR